MRLLSSALLLLFPVSLLLGQDEIPTFTADSRLVVLHASVVDRSGKLVTDIPQKNFKIFENNVEQQIRLFRREDVPVSLCIVIDDSGSMRDKRAKVAAAALGLVKASNKNDEVCVVNFNDEAYLDQPFTNDVGRLEQALEKIESRGGTAMRDAVSMSIDYLKKDAKKDKKVVLVITDGDDTASSETLEKLVAKCQRSEVLVYSIGVLTDEEARKAKAAKRNLSLLAKESGGMSYFPKDLVEVEALAIQIAHEIRNQYIITYVPTNQQLDGSYRTIKVTATGKGNPTVRTRSGYYASPEPKVLPKVTKKS
jgi:Ca-activated chloride channel family protein